MTDLEALATLETFVVQHAVCEERAISTEFSEAKDTGKITVTKRCQKCRALAAATVTKAAAAALLRNTVQQTTPATIEEPSRKETHRDAAAGIPGWPRRTRTV